MLSGLNDRLACAPTAVNSRKPHRGFLGVRHESVAHLEENLAVGAVQLDNEDMVILDGVTHLGAPSL